MFCNGLGVRFTHGIISNGPDITGRERRNALKTSVSWLEERAFDDMPLLMSLEDRTFQVGVFRDFPFLHSPPTLH